MRILIDTNIIIPLEDSTDVLNESLAELVRLSHENTHLLLVHPRTTEDLNRDKDEARKKSILSRLGKYHTLEHTNSLTEDILEQYKITDGKANDNVDNAILGAVYHNTVHLLITEDRGIHRKATRLGISDSVLYLQQAVDVLNRLHPKEYHVFHPNLKNIFLHETQLTDEFYESLREDYENFNKWFEDKCAEGRKAWANFNQENNKLDAILIYKREENEIITDDNRGLPGHSIKISTFKVGEKIRGKKVGELLFKNVLEYAFKNNIEWVYLTIHPEKHEFLKDLCIDLGFEFYGTDIKGRDEVYIKPVGIKLGQPIIDNPFEFYRRYSPSLRCDTVNKYIIPIQKQYHEVLFPDNQKRPSLFGADDPAGNTIKKAYLCHAQLNHMSPGDIILFYRSGDLKKLTTLAIVEDFFRSNSSEEIVKRVAKRTVYSLEDIKYMARKLTKVVLFRQVMHFEGNISLEWMQSNGIVAGSIQSIRSISDDAYEKVMNESSAKNCVNVD